MNRKTNLMVLVALLLATCLADCATGETKPVARPDDQPRIPINRGSATSGSSLQTP